MKPFHLAFKVTDISSTREFYIEVLNCPEGRSTENWIDFNFFGHQLSAHVSANMPALDYCGQVDGIKVPIPHFGCILSKEEFIKVQNQLELHNIPFIVKPQTRYKGLSGEQLTMFTKDFSGNPIEFKSFSNENDIFTS